MSVTPEVLQSRAALISGMYEDQDAETEVAQGPTSADLSDSDSESEEDSGGFWSTLRDGALGLGYGTLQGLAPGGFLAPSPAPRSRTFEFFRGAGQTATGMLEMLGGIGGEVGGFVLDATGVGAIAGVPLNVASAVAIANGGASTVSGISTMMSSMGNGGGKTGRKINQDRSESAQEQVSKLEESLKNAKTNAEKEEIKRQLKHWRMKATQKSENHAQRGQGSR